MLYKHIFIVIFLAITQNELNKFVVKLINLVQFLTENNNSTSLQVVEGRQEPLFVDNHIEAILAHSTITYIWH